MSVPEPILAMQKIFVPSRKLRRRMGEKGDMEKSKRLMKYGGPLTHTAHDGDHRETPVGISQRRWISPFSTQCCPCNHRDEHGLHDVEDIKAICCAELVKPSQLTRKEVDAPLNLIHQRSFGKQI